MMLLAFTAVAAEMAVLQVTIHREAGTIHDIAADGALGQCSVAGVARIACPSERPVTFRWGGSGPWEMSGQVVVEPGAVGKAFVMAESGSDAERYASVEVPSPESVRAAFFSTGANPLPPPTRRLVARLVELAGHPDPEIRILVTRSLMPYVRHTSADPFPSGGPSLVPAGLLVRLATDEDPRVRRRAGRLIRELSRDHARVMERREAVSFMKNDKNRRVRKIATILEREVATEGEAEALEAWNGALQRVPKAGAPGRAASNSLAVLRGRVNPDEVDVEEALAVVLRHHPERAWRVWSTWRRELPFDVVNAEFLLRETVGLSQPLLKHWAAEHPEVFADLLERWEPIEPHSERWRVIGRWVDPKADNARLRKVLGLPDRMSDPPQTSKTE